MFAKRLGQGNDAFLSENECFKRFRAYPNGKKAKWQNRVIPIWPESLEAFSILRISILFENEFSS